MERKLRDDIWETCVKGSGKIFSHLESWVVVYDDFTTGKTICVPVNYKETCYECKISEYTLTEEQLRTFLQGHLIQLCCKNVICSDKDFGCYRRCKRAQDNKAKCPKCGNVWIAVNLLQN